MGNAKPGSWKIWVGIFVLLVLVTAGLIVANKSRPVPEATTTDQKEEPAILRGFSLSPKSFEGTDYANFFVDAAKSGNTLSWAGHYQDLTKTVGNAAKTVISEAKKLDLTPVIIVGPNKGEVFDGIFLQGFRSAVLDFVTGNDVPYLGLGNEIDEVYHESTGRYAALIDTIETLAVDVRAASPKTKVFTIFQLERTKGLQGGLFGGQNNPNKHTWPLVTELKNLDFVAFTTYPCLIYKAPAEIPEEYYSDVANQTTLPVSFTEIGWFRETPVAGWESSEGEQADFIARFDELTTRLEPKLAIWPFLYDQAIPTPFQNMGLLGLEQTSSAGLTAWRLIVAEKQP